MKIKTILALLALLIMLPSCSDDDKENDQALAVRLVGTWRLSYASDNTSSETTLTFASNGQFTNSVISTKDMGMVAKTSTIKGAWNVRKGALQMNYDLESLTTSGMTKEEIDALYNNYHKDNLLLHDMNSSGKTYGPQISFYTQAGQDILTLSTINGSFVRVR